MRILGVRCAPVSQVLRRGRGGRRRERPASCLARTMSRSGGSAGSGPAGQQAGRCRLLTPILVTETPFCVVVAGARSGPCALGAPMSGYDWSYWCQRATVAPRRTSATQPILRPGNQVSGRQGADTGGLSRAMMAP